MKDKLITISIRKASEAQLLKETLENAGIVAYMLNLDDNQSVVSQFVRIRVEEADLIKSLKIIELFDKGKLPVGNESSNKKILIPIDFSNYSIKACSKGFSIAKQMDAEVILLHAYLAPMSMFRVGVGSIGVDQEEQRKLLVQIDSDIENIKVLLKRGFDSGKIEKMPYKFEIIEGVPEDVIIDYTQECNPTLVVMGTRGESQKEEDLIGSVTAEVIEHCKVPVLAIPESVNDFDALHTQNLLFATSFDDRTLQSLDKMMNLVGNHKFKLHFVHFDTKRDEWSEVKLAGIRQYFENNFPNVDTTYSLLSGKDILSAVDEYAKVNNISVIVLNTHRRNLFARFFNPTLARKMVFHARIPILVLHS